MLKSWSLYKRNNVYYIHIFFSDKQVKRTLKTSIKAEAKRRASVLISELTMFKNLNLRSFEVNLEKGIMKAEGEKDTELMLKSMREFVALKKQMLELNAQELAQIAQKSASFDLSERDMRAPQDIKRDEKTGQDISGGNGLSIQKMLELYTKMKQLRESTVLAMRTAIDEFSNFCSKKMNEVTAQDVVAFQNFLIEEKKNSARTVDNKTQHIRTIFNFAISRKYIESENPANLPKLLSKQGELSNSYSIFNETQINKIFTSERFLQDRVKDPSFFYVTLLAVLTGMRVGEITDLHKSDFFEINGVNYIKVKESKTFAGVREVPLLPEIYEEIKISMINKSDENGGYLFKYVDREGKGKGNAVGKKFSRLITFLEIKQYDDKLVFHSLRKFFNNYLRQNDVSEEMRNEILGHQNENINIKVYSNKYSIESKAKVLNVIQSKILKLIEY